MENETLQEWIEKLKQEKQISLPKAYTEFMELMMVCIFVPVHRRIIFLQIFYADAKLAHPACVITANHNQKVQSQQRKSLLLL